MQCSDSANAKYFSKPTPYLLIADGHTIEKMRVVWKKGFDQSKVTDNNYISLTQFEYAVFFEENYEEEIASGKNLFKVARSS